MKKLWVGKNGNNVSTKLVISVGAGGKPLQGGSQILYSSFSGLAMLYIYIISIGCFTSVACHYRRIFVHCLSLSAYICQLPVTIGVFLSIVCHYRRIFVYCLSLSAYICSLPVTIGVYLSIARTKILLAGPPWRAPTLVYTYIYIYIYIYIHICIYIYI